MSKIVIFGKTPILSLAELEAVYGASFIEPISEQAASVHTDGINIDKLGGAQKIAMKIDELPFTQWPKARRSLEKNYDQYIKVPAGSKAKFGISTYGFSEKSSEINATALSIKKRLKSNGTSSRVIANKEQELNSAQVNHGGLLKESGTELLVIKGHSRTIIAKTTQVQDIDAYSARDQARPKRDSRVGMLPPKLAQTIINLSGAKSDDHLLDPFCGTGVVLQEALLKDIDVIGSDLEPKMVAYSQENIKWLSKKYELGDKKYEITEGDATKSTWPDFSVIACETYLGRALSAQPAHAVLNKIIHDCNIIHRKFLQNVARQTKNGFRMCIAVPAWPIKSNHLRDSTDGFLHLKVLDSLEELGYNRISFVHVGDKRLIYHRKGQFVARELVVLERT